MSTTIEQPAQANKLAVYIELRQAVEDLEEQLKEAKARCDAMESLILEEFALHGTDKITQDGKTFYRSRDLFVSVAKANSQAVIAACKELGEEALVVEQPVTESINTGTLKSRLKEMIGKDFDMEQIPEQLRKLVSIYDAFKLKVRKK